ncbi:MULTISPECIES: MBL fold metallo-hydrolase [Paracoccus]|uniref:MBL fold metallo-hydrolase n=1 Tax=Paracoccus TaxID=265 RepID=UPI001FB6ADFC|nr:MULTISPECIES: MBL fold metallo-hydrolase [Paracoccus]MCJ1902753.1 MBL fold metallo-hydrolase [Paracoccus versutus]MDF3907354.1 MBL fold metallo-hydrolase [Paracoccus sp. AS002]
MRRLMLCLVAAPAFASEDIPDQYPQSVLYSKPVEVIPNVFSAIGATAPPTYDNAGHNNNLSFIVTDEGVVVVNSGASWQLAEALHAEIRAVTDQPVKLVINENGQGHAMLGNGYWAAQGVPILAHEEAAAEFADGAPQDLAGLQNYAREKAEGTVIAHPTETFTDRKDITMGGVTIEVLHLGPAHSPGDTQVWIPQWSMMIAGDIAFHERMPPIFDGTCTSCWIETWETKFAPLAPAHVIPGHGHPTNLAQVTRYTRDYLADLREKIGAHIEEGGDLGGAYYVDQSRWSRLDTFEELATKNAGVVFAEMEFE